MIRPLVRPSFGHEVQNTTGTTDLRWMESAPARRLCMGRRRTVLCMGRRRTLEKTLRPIAEEHSLSDGELMDGLRPTFPAASGFKAGG